MSGHGLHADCRGRAGVGAHTQRSCFRALAQLWGLVPCRRTAGLCLPVTAGGPWARQTFSCCERRGMLTAESDPGQAMAFSGVHLGQFQRNQSKEKDLRIKSQFSDFIYELFLHFLAIQDYVPKYQVAWIWHCRGNILFSLVCPSFSLDIPFLTVSGSCLESRPQLQAPS